MSIDNELVLLLNSILLNKEPSRLIAVKGERGSGKTAVLTKMVAEFANKGGCLTSLKSVIIADTTTQEICEVVSLVQINFDALSTIYPRHGETINMKMNTIFILDDLELLLFLCSINNKTHILNALINSVFDAHGSCIVASMTTGDTLPPILYERRKPIILTLPEPSPMKYSEISNYICSGDHRKKVNFDVTENIAFLQSTAVTQRDWMASLCFLEYYAENFRDLGPLDSEKSLSLLHDVQTRCSGTVSTQRSGEDPQLFGVDEVVGRLKLLLDVFVSKQTHSDHSLVIDSVGTTGIVLHGPSGCGKTEITRLLSQMFPQLKFHFVNCTGIFSKYLGQSEENLRRIYEKARLTAPSVVILDEVDVIAHTRGSMGGTGNDTGNGKVDVTRRMLAGLLCELDGVVDNSAVLTICTTNALNRLDKAMLRQGRLETVLYVGPLTEDSARELVFTFFDKFEGDIEKKLELTNAVTQMTIGIPPSLLKFCLSAILERILVTKITSDKNFSGKSPLTLPSLDVVVEVVKDSLNAHSSQ